MGHYRIRSTASGWRHSRTACALNLTLGRDRYPKSAPGDTNLGDPDRITPMRADSGSPRAFRIVLVLSILALVQLWYERLGTHTLGRPQLPRDPYLMTPATSDLHNVLKSRRLAWQNF